MALSCKKFEFSTIPHPPGITIVSIFWAFILKIKKYNSHRNRERQNAYERHSKSPAVNIEVGIPCAFEKFRCPVFNAINSTAQLTAQLPAHTVHNSLLGLIASSWSLLRTSLVECFLLLGSHFKRCVQREQFPFDHEHHCFCGWLVLLLYRGRFSRGIFSLWYCSKGHHSKI